MSFQSEYKSMTLSDLEWACQSDLLVVQRLAHVSCTDRRGGRLEFWTRDFQLQVQLPALTLPGYF